MIVLDEKRMFPCPVCVTPRPVKQTKKAKPYVVCDPCGIQLFVRGPAGIAAFERLAERGGGNDLWTRLKEMEKRYYVKCAKCGTWFWIAPELVKTSVFDGSMQGFRCPEKQCGGIVGWEKKQ